MWGGGGLNKLKVFGNFWNLIYVGGGLIEKGDHLLFWLTGDGLIKEGGLIELLRQVV